MQNPFFSLAKPELLPYNNIKKEVIMSDLTLVENQIQTFSLEDQLSLLTYLANIIKQKSIKPSKESDNGTECDDAFGLWKDRNISLESIRSQAWRI